MQQQLPQVEIVTRSPPRPDGGQERRRPSRIGLFLGVFLVSLLLGQVINLSRPAVYRSGATVLTLGVVLLVAPDTLF